MPDLSIHSLLSSEGIRWFMGQFTYNIASPVLALITVISIAYGCLISSGLLEIKRHMDIRQRLAIRLISLEVILFIAIIALLTMVPHAVLLNIDGHILSSNFLLCIISYISFVILIISSTYSISVGRISSIPNLFTIMCEGIKKAAPIYVIYILAAQLYYSILFVFFS
jgi:aminobenzoyl-glutamate transport protein